MVSLNTYAVTQPAIEGLDPSEDGFSYDVTPWLQSGRNILTVVLIGPAAEQPFRLMAERGGQAQLLLDETELLPVPAPWRLWTTMVELTSSVHLSVLVEGQDPAWPSRTRDADPSAILVA